MPPITYYFIDLENVPGVKPENFAGPKVHVIVVAGPKQTVRAASVVQGIAKQRIPLTAFFTEVTRKDALDFVLACEVGRQFAADPRARFIIVSADTGFDALVKHLQALGAEVERRDGNGTAPAAKKAATPKSRAPKAAAAPAAVKKAAVPSPKKTAARKKPAAPADGLEQRVEKMTKRLATGSGNRPKRLNALRSLTQNLLGDGLTDAELEAVLEKLKSARVLEVTDKGAVSYPA